MDEASARRGRLNYACGGFPLAVLIVEAEATSRAELAVAVQALGCTCQVVRTGEEALAVQRRQPADIVLADSTLPGINGLDLCRAIRAQTQSPYAYFVVLMSVRGKEDLLQAVRAGADACLRKPVDLEELEVRLEAGRRVIEINRALEAKNRQLQRESDRAIRAASMDVLTEVSSRRQLEEDLLALQSHARRYGRHFCGALCDVDSFKRYNDRFGHLAGDTALRSVAGAMRSVLRRSDRLYRYGGDEFLAILPDHALLDGAAVMERVRDAVEALLDGAAVMERVRDAVEALLDGAAVMERVRDAVEGLRIRHAPDSSGVWLTISVGVAESRTTVPGRIDGWLKRADVALYAAKAGGRNRVLVDAPSSAA
jgi:diguanylate cyclase (GGDEF)-like protein